MLRAIPQDTSSLGPPGRRAAWDGSKGVDAGTGSPSVPTWTFLLAWPDAPSRSGYPPGCRAGTESRRSYDLDCI